MTSPDLIHTITGFLREIGLPLRLEELPADTFLRGMAIRDGALLVDPAAVRHPGDLLHEAGHLAVLPADRRRSANDADLEGEAGIEVEAIAWSFAAAMHLGLPLDLLFHPDGYRGRSQGLIHTFSAGVYPGLPGLEAAGLTLSERRAREQGVAPYPAMLRWLAG